MAFEGADYKTVKEALDNAAENGYHFVDWRAEDIAVDLATFDSEIEDWEMERIIAAVKSVRGEK